MMEQVNFGYSMKNIGIPGKQEYILRLTHSVNKFCNNLRWRVYFFLFPNEAPAKKVTIFSGASIKSSGKKKN